MKINDMNELYLNNALTRKHLVPDRDTQDELLFGLRPAYPAELLAFARALEDVFPGEDVFTDDRAVENVLKASQTWEDDIRLGGSFAALRQDYPHADEFTTGRSVRDVRERALGHLRRIVPASVSPAQWVSHTAFGTVVFGPLDLQGTLLPWTDRERSGHPAPTAGETRYSTILEVKGDGFVLKTFTQAFTPSDIGGAGPQTRTARHTLRVTGHELKTDFPTLPRRSGGRIDESVKRLSAEQAAQLAAWFVQRTQVSPTPEQAISVLLGDVLQTAAEQRTSPLDEFRSLAYPLC